MGTGKLVSVEREMDEEGNPGRKPVPVCKGLEAVGGASPLKRTTMLGTLPKLHWRMRLNGAVKA